MLKIRIQLMTIGEIEVALIIRDGIDLPVQVELSIP